MFLPVVEYLEFLADPGERQARVVARAAVARGARPVLIVMSESAPAKVRPPVARAVAAVRIDVLVERRGRVELQLVLDGHDAVAALDRRDDAADADGEVDVRRVGEVVLGVGGLRARDVRRTGVERKRVELELGARLAANPASPDGGARGFAALAIRVARAALQSICFECE